MGTEGMIKAFPTRTEPSIVGAPLLSMSACQRVPQPNDARRGEYFRQAEHHTGKHPLNSVVTRRRDIHVSAHSINKTDKQGRDMANGQRARTPDC
ncbi:hypothetical protein ACH3XW_26975 [Acanthocheilonema viteae]